MLFVDRSDFTESENFLAIFLACQETFESSQIDDKQKLVNLKVVEIETWLDCLP